MLEEKNEILVQNNKILQRELEELIFQIQHIQKDGKETSKMKIKQ